MLMRTFSEAYGENKTCVTRVTAASVEMELHTNQTESTSTGRTRPCKPGTRLEARDATAIGTVHPSTQRAIPVVSGQTKDCLYVNPSMFAFGEQRAILGDHASGELPGT